MPFIGDWFNVQPDTMERIISTIIIMFVLTALKIAADLLVKRKVVDRVKLYHFMRVNLYTYTFLSIVLIGRVWVKGVDSIATFLGLASAGLAIALHDTIASLAGWVFILWLKPFEVGDRIQVGNIAGDVIDIRLFQFSLIEIGNWVDAEQSTGRIVHVPNSKVFMDSIANYETGFEYIWHEIPVLITFESDWEKAKKILNDIAVSKAEHLSEGVDQQIRKAAMKYLIYFSKLTPIVYTTVKDCGVLLTIRYIVKPRRRRTSEELIWENILREFAKHSDIELAYPTTRFYNPAAHPQK